MAIIGADERVKQNSTLAWPNIYIAQIVSYFPDGTALQSSGVLVGPNDVLASGHALYRIELGGYVTDVEVVLGRNGDHKPLGIIDAVAIDVASGWVQEQQYSADYGLVTLPQPVGNTTGWMSTASISQPEDYLQADVYSLGYPGDKGGAMQFQTSGAPTSYTNGIYYFNEGLDAVGGQSGSPLILSHSDYGELAIGLVSHENIAPDVNGVLVFSPAIAAQFNEWANNNNSTIENWRATTLYDTHLIDLVANVYTGVLGRDADRGGMDNWLEYMSSGMSAVSMVKHFLYSSEYTNSPTHSVSSNKTTIDNLYQQLFNRAVDTGGASYWNTQLEHGAAFEEVLTKLIYSEEYQQNNALNNYLIRYQWYDSFQLKVYGKNENDTLTGSNKDDFLSGELGNDYLFGGLGDDWLSGGAGNDQLRGGEGKDVFVIDVGSNQADLFLDFNPAQDVIVGLTPEVRHDWLETSAGLQLSMYQTNSTVTLVGVALDQLAELSFM
jgi:V8-like Glu-specific endopeptidase